jgi:hypothetical protein
MGKLFQRKPWLIDLGVVVLLLVLTLLCFWQNVTPVDADRKFIRGSFAQFIGQYYYAAHSLKEGHLPLWNPYSRLGLPFLAKGDVAFFYPPSFLMLQAFNHLGDGEDIYLFMTLYALFHIWLAGVFTYFLAKKIKLSRFSALVAAIVFMFNGTFLAMAGHVMMLASAIWLPLLFLLFIKICEERSSFLALLAGVVVALMILAGYPGHVALNILFIGLYVIYKIWQMRNQPALVRQVIKLVLITLICGLALTSVQYLPLWELGQASHRATLGYKTAAFFDSFFPYRLSEYFAPEIFWYEGSKYHFFGWTYLGIFPLVLAFLAVYFRFKKEYWIKFFTLSGVIFLLLSMGGTTFIYNVCYILFYPFFSKFRHLHSCLYLFNFSFAILAGFGAEILVPKLKLSDQERLKAFFRFLSKLFCVALLILIFLYFQFSKALIQYPSIGTQGNLALGFLFVLGFSYLFFWKEQQIDNSLLKKLVVILKVCIVLFIIHLLFLLHSGKGGPQEDLNLYFQQHVLNVYFLFIVFFALSLGLLFARLQKTDGFLLKNCIILLIIVDLFSFAGRAATLNGQTDWSFFYAKNEVIEYLMKDQDVFRTHIIDKTIPHVRASWRYKIFCPGGKENFTLQRVMRVYKSLYRIPPAARLNDLINLKYFVTDEKLEGENIELAHEVEITAKNKDVFYARGSNYEGWIPGNPGTKIYLYRNLDYYPRAFLAQEALLVADEEEAWKKLNDSNIDLEKVVILERSEVSLPKWEENKEPTTPKPLARIVKYLADEIIIETEASGRSFLVLSDPYYPGWKVFIDGQEGRIYRGDYFLRTVFLEKGKHTVRFVYLPRSFAIGLVITLSTLGLVVLGLLLNLLKFCFRKS